MPAPNERFHASGGVFPQTVLWDLEVCRPPEPLWNPRLREAATTLCAMRATVRCASGLPAKPDNVHNSQIPLTWDNSL